MITNDKGAPMTSQAYILLYGSVSKQHPPQTAVLVLSTIVSVCATLPAWMFVHAGLD